MKYSRQREIILQEVRASHMHPTADMVYQSLKSEHPNLSLGTVYRNLNLLAQHGVLVKLSMPGSSDRYDGNTHSHSHLVCNECGDVQDLLLPEFTQLSDTIQLQTGFAVSSFDLIMEGTCQACREHKSEKE